VLQVVGDDASHYADSLIGDSQEDIPEKLFLGGSEMLEGL
jgi:hypothetical protein